MKHQTVDNAFGFTVDIYGPISLRQNDLSLLRESNINDKLATLQLGELIQYIIFGDSAYKRRSHITSYAIAPQGEALQPILVSWNNTCKKVRISIEWNYGCTGMLFKYVMCEEKMLLQSDYVSKIYTVATLFRNFHAAIYGSQTSNYFNIVMPDNMLRKYILQEDF